MTSKMLNEIIIQGLIKVFFECNMFVLWQVVDRWEQKVVELVPRD
jgi:hypothetical protein